MPLPLAGITALATAATSAWNAWQSWKNNQYQKEVQEETWKREDTAQQRAVADLRAAGLSPTLAAGRGAPTSAPIRPETPNIKQSPAEIAATALNLMQMKADISKTNAEARAMEVAANVAETTYMPEVETKFSQAKYEALKVEAAKLGITKQQLDNKILEFKSRDGVIEQREWNLPNMQLQALQELVRERKYNIDKSNEMGIRTTDHDKYLQYVLAGSSVLNDLVNKSQGGTP